MQPNDGKCGCFCHKISVISAVLLVLIGVAILLQAMGVLDSPQLKLALPIVVILVGLQMLFRRRCNCCNVPQA
jgi:uncharacterized membrane protein YfcA